MRVKLNEVVVRIHEDREKRLRAVRSAFEDILAWVIGDACGLPLHRFDVDLYRRVKGLGLALVGLWLAYRVPDSFPVSFRLGSGWYLLDRLRAEPVRTRFGESWWLRPSYNLVDGEGVRTVAPSDGEIGLAAGRMSLTVHLLAAQMAARMSFEEAKEVTEALGDYAPATKSTQGIVDILGPRATQYMLNLPAPDDDGEILGIEFDGKGIPHMTEAEHVRRCKPHKKRARGVDRSARKMHRRKLRKGRERKKVGDKSKNARVATIGVVYTLHRRPDGSVEGPINRRVFAMFSNPAGLAKAVLADAKKRGYGTKETLFLADGAPHLWKIWRKYFPKATPCLDWYHASEYLWKAGAAVHGPKSPALRPWVEARMDELMRGDVDAVITALCAARDAWKADPAKGKKGRGKKIKRALRYVRNHREMMQHYGDLDGRDLPCGTGLIEGTIKHIGTRMDGSMRWSTERSESILALRCVLLSDEWDGFEEHVRAVHDSGTDAVIPRVTPRGRLTPHKSAKKAA